MLFYRQVIRKSEPKQQVSYSKSVSIELNDNKDLFLSWRKNILLCLNTRWEGHIQPRNVRKKIFCPPSCTLFWQGAVTCVCGAWNKIQVVCW